MPTSKWERFVWATVAHRPEAVICTPHSRLLFQFFHDPSYLILPINFGSILLRDLGINSSLLKTDHLMNPHIYIDHAPPRSWDQFEELCADIFQAEWKDPALVRHGRAGQRQNGVDIVARNGANYPIGLQCKKRAKWPVSKLTKKQISADVNEALKFVPSLKSFYILTTAPDDASLLDHVRKINQGHAANGLFDVVLLGWNELARRASLHPQVSDKHFGPSGVGAPRSPLLATWMMSGGKIVLTEQELELCVQELALDFHDWPAGHIAVRQRESDVLAESLRALEGNKLSVPSRKQRIKIRNDLRRLVEEERFAERGIKLMLTDPDLSSYILNVWEKEAHLVIEGFMNTQVARGASNDQEPDHYLRLHWPDKPEEWISASLSAENISAIWGRNEAFKAQFGNPIVECVSELPAGVRAKVAIPRIIRGLLELISESQCTWEEVRRKKLLHLGSWAYSIN